MVVGHTLVDASSWLASVLMINPNAEEVVLPSFTCVGKLVPVSAVSVGSPGYGPAGRWVCSPAIPFGGNCCGISPFAGEAGRRLLRELLYRHKHVFPALGEPVTGRTTSVQHEILTSEAYPVRCRPRRLAPQVFGRNKHVFKKCC